MSLTAGIVGLPNVGKSTLFNALTKASALAANYPFATIEPNVGVVLVPDERLDFLAKMSSSKKIVPALCEFTDIAGLVKGASKGEGLGNQFLSNIRSCDAIVHIVRCFDDGNITHVMGSVDPIRDVEIINLELILADLDICEKRIPKIEKKALAKIDDAQLEYEVLVKIKEALLKEIPIRLLEFNEIERKYVDGMCFLTNKNVLYVANIKEDYITNPSSCPYYGKLNDYALKDKAKIVPFCAQLEAELSVLSDEDRELFLEDYGIEKIGLDLLIKQTYELLGLATYLTTGITETKAWTFKKGMTAPQCAGIIHSDFQRGFIRAEIVSYDDLVIAGNMQTAKEQGKVRQEGKEYIVKDGDVILFKFNV